MLYSLLLLILLVLISSMIAYMIIGRRYRSGVFIENVTADAAGAGENVQTGDAGMVALQLLTLTAATNTDPLVINEDSKTRKLYGGFIIQCSQSGTNATVTFTAKDGTADIGSEAHTFESTSANVVETVKLEWEAPKTTATHDIRFQCNLAVDILRVDFYYY